MFQNVAVQVGQRLSVNDRVGNLIDTGRLEARFHISDGQYGRLTSTSQGVIGRKARVIWRVGQREIVLNAAVARIPETVRHPGNIVYGAEDGRLAPRRAEIVGRVGNDVLLRGELSDGERLVTTQSVAIAPGLRVELR